MATDRVLGTTCELAGGSEAAANPANTTDMVRTRKANFIVERLLYAGVKGETDSSPTIQAWPALTCASHASRAHFEHQLTNHYEAIYATEKFDQLQTDPVTQPGRRPDH
jgi:hypothetical protein